MIEFRCEPLSKQHDRQRFSCESLELESWLQHRARQDQQRRVAAVYVMVPEVEAARIAGFYTLSATSIILSDLPEKFARKLPRYPMVPAILLGRLARDTAFPGVGEKLLLDAMNRALRSSKEIAAAAIVVDSKNDHADHFYRRHGFEPITTDSNRLYVPMGTVEKTFNG
jgi:predicted GNAT family N-acyltransferase